MSAVRLAQPLHARFQPRQLSRLREQLGPHLIAGRGGSGDFLILTCYPEQSIISHLSGLLEANDTVVPHSRAREADGARYVVHSLHAPINRIAVDRQAAPTIPQLRSPIWKRTMDISVALIGLILMLPLFVLTAIAIKICSPGPILFCQRRTGSGGQSFSIYKFRTMTVDAEDRKAELLDRDEQDGPAFKIENDPRITPIGHWLRRLSLDELPQLLNVLKGDMSLVGPRPLPCDEAAKCEPWQQLRHAVTPGMTCYWQVHDRTQPLPFDRWMQLDLDYICNRSLKTDLIVLLRTVKFVLGFRGR